MCRQRLVALREAGSTLVAHRTALSGPSDTLRQGHVCAGSDWLLCEKQEAR